MEQVILDRIPLKLSLRRLAKKLRLPDDDAYLQDLKTMVAEARAVGRPKALYRMVFIEFEGDDTIVIDGVTFKSRVLRVNTDQAHRVFPYVATCGLELEEWSHTKQDLLQSFWADGIKEMAVYEAMRVLRNHLVETFEIKRASTMAPGSLSDWPIQQQRPLFALLGNVKDAIGVELSHSLLMQPSKSVSGILFPTEGSFESCQLCPRPSCPNRRAPYDKDLYDQKYRPTGGAAG